MTATRPKAVVIGAGPAGLAAALVLQRRFTDPGAVVVLERSSVAESWRSRYAELSLNTTRLTSGLPGRRIPRSAGRWVARNAYIDYLERAASALSTPVQLGVTVQRVTSAADGGWALQSDGGGITTPNVVVATGNEATPHAPQWPGRNTFGGRVHHVADLRRITDLAGKRVIVVGAGNSGTDVASLLVGLGTDIAVAMRTPPTILPREHRGVPLQAVAVATRWLPRRAKDALTLATAKSAMGDLTAYGIPRPSVGPFTRFAMTGVTVSVDTGFVAALREGRARVIGVPVSWTESGLRMEDGCNAEADVVVLATGFRCGLEGLVGHLGVLDERGRPRQPLPGPAVSLPGLFFAGYRPAVEGTLRSHARDARVIARRCVDGLTSNRIATGPLPTRHRRRYHLRRANRGGVARAALPN